MHTTQDLNRFRPLNSVILYVLFGDLHCVILEYILEGSLPSFIYFGGRVTGILAWHEFTSPTRAVPKYPNSFLPSTSPTRILYNRHKV